MPRSLPSEPGLQYLRKEAKRLLPAHQGGDVSACEVLRCHHRFQGSTDADILAAGVSLQEMQHALAVDYGFRNWSTLRRSCYDVRPLACSVHEGRCDRRHAEQLQLLVTEVLRTSPAVRTKEQFPVRGEYELAADSDIARIMLAGLGRNRGKPCHLSPESRAIRVDC
jgi:hypothetical protein